MAESPEDRKTPEPVFFDEYFRKKPKKHGGEWKIVDAPCLFVKIADTHAHLDMLGNPALALARAAVHKVGFIETMVDPLGSEGTIAFDALDGWLREANLLMRQMGTRICGQGWNSIPQVRISVGVHPHVAKDFDDAAKLQLLHLMHDERVSAVGEIGLDYHYDHSPRERQKAVFESQLILAKEAGLPVVLHVREAFDDAFAIMQRTGWNDAGVLLHCYTSDGDEIKRWADAGCYIAFGGAFTFKKLDMIRKAAVFVPKDKLLTETDAPFMTPEPFRGTTCEPAHVIWTAEALAAELLPDANIEQREAFFEQTYSNAVALLDRPATPWQRGV